MNSKNKPNGHGALLANGSGANGGTISLSGMGRAASDDASELSVANAAASSAAARADRDACADVARSQGEGKRSSGAGTASRNPNEKDCSKASGAAKGSPKLLPSFEAPSVDGDAVV